MIRSTSGALLRGALALAAAGLLLAGMLPGVAQAKGPEPSEMPTLEQIFQDAKAEKEAAERAAVEAARDPNREAIEAYATGATELSEFQALTELINDSKTDELQRYRQPAATAILQRFRAENLDDPAIRRVRAALALEIVDLMKANSSDQVGLAIIQEVLQTWWRAKVAGDIRFRATDKWRDRQKAWRKMKSYLQGGERN
jgi:hypothetical protein